jgi:hypothetical protein
MGFDTIIRNAKFRILPPQPASLVSTGQTAKTPQNHAIPRHFADTARSPCQELDYRSVIPAPGLRGRFLVSRFCSTHGRWAGAMRFCRFSSAQNSGGIVAGMELTLATTCAFSVCADDQRCGDVQGQRTEARRFADRRRTARPQRAACLVSQCKGEECSSDCMKNDRGGCRIDLDGPPPSRPINGYAAHWSPRTHFPHVLFVWPTKF